MASCGIHFADANINRALRDLYGNYRYKTFLVEENNLNKIKRKMLIDDCKCKKELPIFELVEAGYTSFKTPRNINSYSDRLKTTCVCGAKLKSRYTLIPLKDHPMWCKVDGLVCSGKCEKIYVKNKDIIRDLLLDNIQAKEFTLNSKYLWNYTVKSNYHNAVQMYRKIKSAILFVRIRNYTDIKTYIIVTEQKDCCTSKGIIHFTNILARILIAMVNGKRESVKIDNKYYTIYDVIHDVIKKSEELEKITVTMLNIYPNGGREYMYNDKKLQKLLLFSPYNETYEIINSTFIPKDDCCYTDISLFRNFVFKYGNPKVELYNASEENIGENSLLHNESLLHMYGYNVSQKDNFTAGFRRELLKEIVDLEILSIIQVAWLLERFINSHKNQTTACGKWESDLKYIKQYTPQPTRFLKSESKEI